MSVSLAEAQVQVQRKEAFSWDSGSVPARVRSGPRRAQAPAQRPVNRACSHSSPPRQPACICPTQPSSGLRNPLERRCGSPSGVEKPHGVERDLTNEGVVGHHHGHCPEQGLEEEQLVSAHSGVPRRPSAEAERSTALTVKEKRPEDTSAPRDRLPPRAVQVRAVTLRPSLMQRPRRRPNSTPSPLPIQLHAPVERSRRTH